MKTVKLIFLKNTNTNAKPCSTHAFLPVIPHYDSRSNNTSFIYYRPHGTLCSTP